MVCWRADIKKVNSQKASGSMKGIKLISEMM